MNLKELGFTQEELQQRVVDQCVAQVMESTACDEDGDVFPVDSPIANKLTEAVRKHINDKVNEIAEAHVLPRVTEMIESLSLQKTNEWGEPKSEKITFVEYLVQRAEAWIVEKVDREGKGKKEADSYHWNGTQTRLAHLVEKHLHYSIEQAMKNALQIANGAIANGIQETVKIKLAEITQGLRVEVKTK